MAAAVPTGSRGSDWDRVESLRSALYAPAVGLIVTGIVAAFAGWGFVTAALAIALGAIMLDNYSSSARLHDKLSGRVGCCGVEEPAGAAGRSRGGCCCGRTHVFPLSIATCVFACIDILWAFPVSITQHNYYLCVLGVGVGWDGGGGRGWGVARVWVIDWVVGESRR